MPRTLCSTAAKAPRGRSVLLLLILLALASAGIVDAARSLTKLNGTTADGKPYSGTWNIGNWGRAMKPTEIAEGITVAVPANFPRAVKWEEGPVKVISFSLKPHEQAARFLHFFEIRLSPEELASDQILADLGYEIGAQQAEEITVDGRKSVLTTTAIRITLPCGSQQDATFYSWAYYCAERKTHVLVATFTMMRGGFLDIVTSLRCP